MARTPAPPTAELGARCPSCNALLPGGSAAKPCPECGYTNPEACFIAECPTPGECVSAYHHGPTGSHFWAFDQDQPLDVRLRLIEEHLGIARPAPPPPTPEERESRIGRLEERLAAARAELSEAEDGQTWVDAIATEIAGLTDERRQVLEAAVAALDALTPSKGRRGRKEEAKAIARARGATADLQYATLEGKLAHAAAQAYAEHTVAPARARVAELERSVSAAKKQK